MYSRRYTSDGTADGDGTLPHIYKETADGGGTLSTLAMEQLTAAVHSHPLAMIQLMTVNCYALSIHMPAQNS
jgi:hypothetical protein